MLSGLPPEHQTTAMPIPSALPKGLRRFQLAPAMPICEPVTIVASNAELAWSKFVTQRFGALKPARSEWVIGEVSA